MTGPDISSMSYNDLNDLRTHITARMKEMRETGVSQLRLKLVEEAAALGIAVEEIVGVPKKRRKRRKHKDDGAAGEIGP